MMCSCSRSIGDFQRVKPDPNCLLHPKSIFVFELSSFKFWSISVLYCICLLLYYKASHCIFMASWYDSSTLHLHMLLKKSLELGSLSLNYANKLFQHDTLLLQQTSISPSQGFWGGGGVMQNFLLTGSLICFLFLSLLAGSSQLQVITTS